MRAIGLRSEDLLLAAWNVVGVPIVALSGLSPILALGDAPDPAAGIIQLVAVLGAIVAVARDRPARLPSPRPSAPMPGWRSTARWSGPWRSCRDRPRRTLVSVSTGSSSAARSS
jgi:hypothetical protein